MKGRTKEWGQGAKVVPRGKDGDPRGTVYGPSTVYRFVEDSREDSIQDTKGTVYRKKHSLEDDRGQ